MDITVIVPVHNRFSDIDRLLSSLKLIEAPGQITIRIVDDGGTVDYDPLIQDFKNSRPDLPISLLKIKSSVGPAKARNTILRDCDTSHVWFLDSDAEVVNPDTLIRANEIFTNNPTVRAVGEEIVCFADNMFLCRTRFFPNFFFRSSFLPKEKAEPCFAEAIPSSNLIVDRRILESIGYFNEDLKLFEDVDLCFRIRHAGYKLFSSPSLAAIHHSSPSGRTGAYNFYQTVLGYSRTFHLARIQLIRLHNPRILCFLPFIDLTLGVYLFLDSVLFNRSAEKTAKKKRNASFGIVSYAFCHFLGILLAYFSLLIRLREDNDKTTL
ncbi:MAG: hypothetical protein A3K03_09760 [Bdellovibrionales bacterium RIFOXYD1_FULL_44_7]|nr:MAG: hypothetical protein A3K03_09760 [Bdellovibrionales bacterium RIFOXYD1_FULL_44_7]